jgi:hypothetical protein
MRIDLWYYSVHSSLLSQLFCYQVYIYVPGHPAFSKFSSSIFSSNYRRDKRNYKISILLLCSRFSDLSVYTVTFHDYCGAIQKKSDSDPLAYNYGNPRTL